MSEYERNKGRLIPVQDSIEAAAEQLIETLPRFYDSKAECLIENASDYGHEVIDGKLFRVEWEIHRSWDSDPEFCEVTKNDDGTISFHTYHYNGGAHWTELLEGKV